MTKKWNMVIDVALCHDCNNCFLACKDEYVGNDFKGYSAAQPWFGQRWMNVERKERGQFPMVQVAFLPTPCQHCDNAPCVTKDKAVYKRKDGLVLIDPKKAHGRTEIVDSCPYGVIYWNDELGIPQKCTGCAHLIDDGWTETRCTQVCPTGALKLVLAEDEVMTAQAQAEGRSVSERTGHQSTGLVQEPSPLDNGLRRRHRSLQGYGRLRGGAIVLLWTGAKVAGATTNNYGNFIIDKLEPGTYEVSINAAGYRQPPEKSK
jgi:Fe-S-cluster-containing dehydrogenase component